MASGNMERSRLGSVYIYTILAKKLEFQAKYIGDNDIHTQAKRDAEIMRTCIRLIERQQEDYYTMEYIDHHHTEHEFIPVEEVGGYTVEGGSEFYEIKSTMISENFDAYFAKYPRQYKLAKMGHLNRFKRELDPRENKKIAAMEIACENQERSRRLLFKILEQNIDRWWD